MAASAGDQQRAADGDRAAHRVVGSALHTATRAVLRELAAERARASLWSQASDLLRRLGKRRFALAAARQAVQLDPWLAVAHFNEGAALHSLGNQSAAIVSYLAAGLQPQCRAAAQHELAAALRELARRGPLMEDARIIARQFLSPDSASLAAIARGLLSERPATAVLLLEHAARSADDPARARELATLLWQQGRTRPAFECLLRSMARHPSDVLAFRLLGEWLSAPRALPIAPHQWTRFLSAFPDDTTALTNLGVALRRRGYSIAATALHRRALNLDRTRISSWINLGSALLSQGQASSAAAVYRELLTQSPSHAQAISNLLFCLHLVPEETPESLFEAHVALSARLAPAGAAPGPRKAVGAPVIAKDSAAPPSRRLRIGYVSPDFREHPVAQLLEPVMRHHDRTRFEIFCYSDVEHPDATTKRLEGLADRFVATAEWSNPRLLEKVRSDQVDILVDLAGHTARNRLVVFAERAAPVQVSWLGYFNTTGVSAIDYRIADAHSVPPSAERHFVEKIVRLPRSANCFLPSEAPPPAASPCTENGWVTFGCFNNPAKLSPQVIEAFCDILALVPNSRLLLKYSTFNEPAMCARVRDCFSERGITPTRVEFHGSSAFPAFLESFRHIDVALDPFPYSGETTALHTLWMGVPLVSIEGPTPVQRLGSRVLRLAGLDEWVATSTADYVRIAASLGNDPALLAQVRPHLRSRLERCPLLDHAAVTRDLEHAYERMFARGPAAATDSLGPPDAAHFACDTDTPRH